jgi:hypothetical protein
LLISLFSYFCFPYAAANYVANNEKLDGYNYQSSDFRPDLRIDVQLFNPAAQLNVSNHATLLINQIDHQPWKYSSI